MKGNDNVDGGIGDDIVDGGSGSDTVNGGAGNDLAIYNMTQNMGDTDRYLGGSGTDTIELQFSLSQWANTTVQADIARYMSFLAQRAGSGEIGTPFDFKAFGLTVQQFEKLQVKVDGILVNLTGNDGPRIGSADDSGSVTEKAEPFEGGILSDSGVINFTDFDLTDGHSVSVAPGGSNYIGSLTASVANASTNDGAGSIAWSFQVDDSATDFLAAGETRTQTYAVTINDGQGGIATQSVTITVTGTNDAPAITSEAQTGSVQEDTQITATGQVISHDVDNGATTAYSGNASGTYGSFAVNAGTGAWTYTLDNDAHQDLAEGESHDEVFTVTVTDDKGATATQNVTVTVTGTNDKPVIGDPSVTQVTEDIGVNGSGDLTAAGTISISDPDQGQSSFLTAVTPAPGNLGSLSLAANGTYSYTVANSLVQGLDNLETKVDTFTIASLDGTTKQISFTINGADDTPTLDPVQSGSVAEIDQSASRNSSGLSGALAGHDLDVETLSYGIQGGASNGGGTVSLAGAYGTLTVDSLTGGYVYAQNATAIEGLDATETYSDVFTLTVSDGDAPLGTQTYTVNVAGADDAPTLDAVNNGSIAEVLNSTSTIDSGLAGTLMGHDVDVETLAYGIQGGSSSGVNQVSLAGSYGTLTVNTTTGAYDYAKNAAAIEALTTGQNPSDIFTFTVTDGDGALVTQSYTVNLSGANDGPPRFAPTDISLTPTTPPNSVNFNSFAFSATLAATDPDPGAISFAITGQSNAGMFSISGNNLTASSLGEKATLNVTVQATQTGDPSDMFTTETFTILTGSNGNSGETLNGSVTGDDILYGNGNNQLEMLVGLGGNDALFGMAGNDQLSGGAGNDVLVGASGVDQLTGGTEADRFVFLNATDSTTANRDTITDFEEAVAGEVIDLLGIDANTTLAGDQAFLGVNNSTSITANSINWFVSGGNTFIQADVNGNSGADFEIMLLGAHTLTGTGLTSDFML